MDLLVILVLSDTSYAMKICSHSHSCPGLPLAVKGLICLVVFLLATTATADGDELEQSEGSDFILLIEHKKAGIGGIEPLRIALEAHLDLYSINVQLHRVRSLPRKPSAQVKRVRSWVLKQEANGAIWLDIQRKSISLIFTDREGNEHSLQRNLECISREIGSCGEAIASIVNSVLSTWIGHQFSDQNPPEPAVSITDNELSPVEIEKEPWVEPDSEVRLFLDGGYGLMFFKGRQSVTHGLHLGVGVVFQEYFQIQVTSDLIRSVTSKEEVDGKRIEINRWPFRFLVGGVIPVENNWLLGFTLGLVLDLNSVQPVTDGVFIDGVDDVNPGFAAAVSVRYSVLEWLGVWLDFGMDVYAYRLKKTVEQGFVGEKTIVSCGQVQGRAALGLVAFWGFTKH